MEKNYVLDGQFLVATLDIATSATCDVAANRIVLIYCLKKFARSKFVLSKNE